MPEKAVKYCNTTDLLNRSRSTGYTGSMQFGISASARERPRIQETIFAYRPSEIACGKVIRTKSPRSR
ncbi:uncharacterized protein MYCFIDRAFT_201225 [Pseudocercospora fijiensis CIRAD86]|uniref:Uncharacterized protein n=1 Tax=Pseudocercospora fijiensis (strain CIRAD86) TaxID=383855 RepID=N1Q9X3_PSEFD|nr:uncharacterized protein MYCFIDRAFT_201225 [Pseudocercospora fijiensis CIRAD86]EME87683.1 hypothetical protein MYCFIDRAFT_201225 [Pseudocercospora fijiensis CIRAD86]